MYDAGQINENTLVWRPGWLNWKTVAEAEPEQQENAPVRSNRENASPPLPPNLTKPIVSAHVSANQIKCPHCQALTEVTERRMAKGIVLTAFAFLTGLAFLTTSLGILTASGAKAKASQIPGAIIELGLTILCWHYGHKWPRTRSRCNACHKIVDTNQLYSYHEGAVTDITHRIEMVMSGRGPAPAVTAIMEPGERPLWAESASLIEEQVIKRGWQGGSRGVRVRVAKGVSVRLGATKGTYTRQKGMVPVSQGQLILTTKRLIFNGTPKIFATRLDRIMTFEASKDIVTCAIERSERLKIFRLENESGDFVEAIFRNLIA